MNIAEAFRIALAALRANKFRAVLTMLGVVIGVSSVILLVSIGTGVRDDMVGTIEGMGSNLLFVFPGKMEGMDSAPNKRFTMEDYEYLKQRLPEAEAVVAIAQGKGTAKVGNKTMRVGLSGANDVDNAFKSEIAHGRRYRRAEIESSARVAVIGSRVAEELFPNREPLGKTIVVEGQRLTVVGVMPKKGGSMAGDQDGAIGMPVGTVLRIMNTNDLTLIGVKVRETKDLEPMTRKIKRVLRPRFGDEASAYSQKETSGALDEMMGTITVMLAGIAGISLLVGGIGIMNIMLVSVSERTREIGIRKAVGARTFDVLAQFVIEAVVLSALGGVIGILLGAGGASALSAVMPTTVAPWSAAMAFAFSAAIGVFFGVYPASKAARMDPIVALRHD
jgi:putative ABC transport system permease protein